jgi:hypothetical protein
MEAGRADDRGMSTPPGISSQGDATSALAAEFAAIFRSQPMVIERLLAEHIDDGTGRCRVCPSGPQAARKVWPCALYEYAVEATRQNRTKP